MILVFLVVYLFLQSWRAAIIPFAAVPVSLIGTFAGIYLFYSINTLTLFGMVLSIGIVVDDAIVVLENVERIMREEGAPPRGRDQGDARGDRADHRDRADAGRGVHPDRVPGRPDGRALPAVRRHDRNLGGDLRRGRADAFAGAFALILKPHEAPNRFFAAFNRWFARVTARYTDGVVFLIRRGLLGLALFLGMVAVTAALWKYTPTSLVPDEDQGFYIAAVILPDGATLSRTDRVVAKVEEAIRSNPNNEDVVSFTGLDFIGGGFRNSAATIFVTQKHWDERKVTAQELVGELFGKTMGIKALVLAFNPPPIFGLGTAGGYEFYPEPGQRRHAPLRSRAGLPRPRQPGSAAWAAHRRSGARRRRSSSPTSTARRRRRSASRSTTCSTRSRPRWARSTSTTSTGTDGPGRC